MVWKEDLGGKRDEKIRKVVETRIFEILECDLKKGISFFVEKYMQGIIQNYVLNQHLLLLESVDWINKTTRGHNSVLSPILGTQVGLRVPSNNFPCNLKNN